MARPATKLNEDAPPPRGAKASALPPGFCPAREPRSTGRVSSGAVLAQRDWPICIAGGNGHTKWNRQNPNRIPFVLPRTLRQDLLERDTKAFISRWPVRKTARTSSDFATPSYVCAKESVRDALENGFPSRLGQAISALHNGSPIEHIRSKGIHLEFCPTSNLPPGAAPNMGEHPMELASSFRNLFEKSLAARFEPRLTHIEDFIHRIRLHKVGSAAPLPFRIGRFTVTTIFKNLFHILNQ